MSTENFIEYTKEVKKNKKPKYDFLKKIINPEDISRMNPELVNDEHLKQLDNHFKKIEKKFSKEIGEAASWIREKIKFIVYSSWETQFSWEIMQAANNENYVEKNKIINNIDYKSNKSVV